MFPSSPLEFGVVVQSSQPLDANLLPVAPSKPEVTDIGRTSITLAWKSKPSPSAESPSYLIEAFRLDTDVLTFRIRQPSFEVNSLESFSFLPLQLHAGQQMGNPGRAHKEPEFHCEEPEARYCLLVYGQSGEFLWPQRPQSNLRLSEDTRSVLALYFLLKGTGRAERHFCFIFESVGSVSLLYLLSIHFPPADSVSTMPEVDHRHIQRELGNVIIRLHTPTVISSSAVRVQWTVRAPLRSTLLLTSPHIYRNYKAWKACTFACKPRVDNDQSANPKGNPLSVPSLKPFLRKETACLGLQEMEKHLGLKWLQSKSYITQWYFYISLFKCD